MNYFLDVTNGSTTFVYRSDKDQNLLGTTDRNFTEFDYNLNFDSSDSQMSDFFLIGNDILNENMNSNIIKGDGTSVFHCYYYKGRLDASYFEALVNALPNIAVQYSVQFTQANLLNTPSLYDICWVLFRKSSNYSSSYNSSGNNELLYKPTFHLDLTDTTITSIQPNTAFNCHALRSISIPRTVTYISRNTFKDCDFLELVWLSSEDNKQWYYRDNAYNEYPIETPMLPETIARMLKNDGYELIQH